LSGAGSAEPGDLEELDPSLLLEDEIGDEPLSTGAEARDADRLVRVVGVDGLPGPWGEFEGSAQLGESGQRFGR
jgi:hypothetical protein